MSTKTKELNIGDVGAREVPKHQPRWMAKNGSECRTISPDHSWSASIDDGFGWRCDNPL